MPPAESDDTRSHRGANGSEDQLTSSDGDALRAGESNHPRRRPPAGKSGRGLFATARRSNPDPHLARTGLGVLASAGDGLENAVAVSSRVAGPSTT